MQTKHQSTANPQTNGVTKHCTAHTALLVDANGG